MKIINYTIEGQEAIIDCGTEHAKDMFAGYSKKFGSQSLLGCVRKDGKITISLNVLNSFEEFKIEATPCELRKI